MSEDTQLKIPALLLLVLPALVFAEIRVSDARIVAPIPGQSISAGYFLLSNGGSDARALVGVKSGSASRIEMHTHVMEDTMMRMVEMESVALPAGEAVLFTEGGLHLMLFDPEPAAIRSGQMDLILEFDDGSLQQVSARVEQR